jgi:hypothetical protein
VVATTRTIAIVAAATNNIFRRAASSEPIPKTSSEKLAAVGRPRAYTPHR